MLGLILQITRPIGYIIIYDYDYSTRGLHDGLLYAIMFQGLPLWYQLMPLYAFRF